MIFSLGFYFSLRFGIIQKENKSVKFIISFLIATVYSGALSKNQIISNAQSNQQRNQSSLLHIFPTSQPISTEFERENNGKNPIKMCD